MSLIDSSVTVNIKDDFQGISKWRSPSNIALIKYWGKRPIQIPANASISFTLLNACTVTSVQYQSRRPDKDWISFSLDREPNIEFNSRISKYFKSLGSHMPFLKDLSFKIESSNTFPHSSGIASSASGMSALAIALCEIENLIVPSSRNFDFFQRASFIARLGSGSASRSVFPNMALWGHTEYINESSDDFAIPFENYNDIFQSFHDDILIVSNEKKSVSSTAGHELMNSNIFATSRYNQADRNLKNLLEALKSGDLFTFGQIVEDEALTLHALMMCSNPSYILMKPATLTVIEKVREFRKNERVPVFFTLDAGPNVHILYPDSVASTVTAFIDQNLLELAVDNKIIKDRVGPGPLKLE